MGDGDALVDVIGAEGGAGGFGGDGFDRFAVDRDLPAADALVLAVFLFPNGEAPFLEEVDGVVDMAADVVDQIFAGEAHHIVDDVVYEIGGGVPAVALAHIAVDGGKALAGGAAALDDRFFGEDHAEAVAGPEFGFEGGAAAGHTAADYQDVAINRFGGLKCHGFPPSVRRLGGVYGTGMAGRGIFCFPRI